MMENRLLGRDRQVELRNPQDATWNVLDMSNPDRPVIVTDPVVRTAMMTTAMQSLPLPAPYAVRVDPDSLRHSISRPDRSVFGTQLESWLARQMEASVQSGKRWQIVGNQMVMGRTTGVDIPGFLGPEGWQRAFEQVTPILKPWLKQLETLPTDLPFEFDGWNAYPAARERMDTAFSASEGCAVVLSGDSHAFWINDLKDMQGRQVAAEIGTTAITSSSLGNMLGNVELGSLFSQSCPEVRFCQHLTKGYSLVTLRPDDLQVDLIGMSTVLSRDFERFVLRSFTLTIGDDGWIQPWKEITYHDAS